MTSNLTTTDGIWTEQSPLQSNQDTNSNPAVINDNNGNDIVFRLSYAAQENIRNTLEHRGFRKYASFACLTILICILSFH